MSEDKPKYSDPEDRVDYRVIKSYRRASKSDIRNKLSYAIAFVIILALFMQIIFQSIKLGELETKRPELESKVTELENKMGNLENKVTELENKMGNLETKVTELQKKVTELESRKNLESQKN